MERITVTDGVTPVNKAFVDTLQDNIEDAIDTTQETLENSINSIISTIYPIGAIYMSTVSTNPSTYLGGTWVAWGSGRVPVGVNTSDSDFETVEKTGGEKTHKLTIAEMPIHSHDIWTKISASSGSGFLMRGNGGTDEKKWGGSGREIGALNTGGDAAHNNLQPYITCYMWKRTA